MHPDAGHDIYYAFRRSMGWIVALAIVFLLVKKMRRTGVLVDVFLLGSLIVNNLYFKKIWSPEQGLMRLWMDCSVSSPEDLHSIRHTGSSLQRLL